jgi:hypothetical protein
LYIYIVTKSKEKATVSNTTTAYIPSSNEINDNPKKKKNNTILINKQYLKYIFFFNETLFFNKYSTLL